MLFWEPSSSKLNNYVIGLAIACSTNHDHTANQQLNAAPIKKQNLHYVSRISDCVYIAHGCKCEWNRYGATLLF
jgi:hypothetical protein